MQSLAIIKVLTIAGLFFTFLMVFGLNAYKTFQRGDVMFADINQPAEPLKFPALTICKDLVK